MLGSWLSRSHYVFGELVEYITLCVGELVE